MKFFKSKIYIFGEKPQTDWRRILLTGLILAIAVSTYGFVFYNKTSAVINEAGQTTNVVVETKPTSNFEPNQIIELYLQKKENFQKMVSQLKKS